MLLTIDPTAVALESVHGSNRANNGLPVMSALTLPLPNGWCIRRPLPLVTRSTVLPPFTLTLLHSVRKRPRHMAVSVMLVKWLLGRPTSSDMATTYLLAE